MSTRIPKIGDRYSNDYYTWEVVSHIRLNVNGDYVYGCVIILGNGLEGNVFDAWYTDDEDEYLGNFTKDTNFNELYDLFNSI